jgi:predicted metal-dependent enzyme (double-stranded beta helix superfamily)/rhodanese-related sulfurtransferase
MSEIKTYNPQRFHHFLAHMTRLMDQVPNEAQALNGATLLLGDLVTSDDWLLPDFAQPHPQHYQQYLLYADPQDRFSVVSFVWGPGQATPIHDHTVWGLIGMLRGSEMCQSYSRMSDGRWAPAGLQIQMIPGDVEAVSPRLGDVHRVWNAYADQTSISIHVYGANIGKLPRSVYYEDGTRRTFISGYSNVPELFSGLVNETNLPQASVVTTTSTPLINTTSQVTSQVGGVAIPKTAVPTLANSASPIAVPTPGAKPKTQATQELPESSELSELSKPREFQTVKQTPIVQSGALKVEQNAHVDKPQLADPPSGPVKGVQVELPLLDEDFTDEDVSVESLALTPSDGALVQMSLVADGSLDQGDPANSHNSDALDNSADNSLSRAYVDHAEASSTSSTPLAPLNEGELSLVNDNLTYGETTTTTGVDNLTEQVERVTKIGGFDVITTAQVRAYLLAKTETALIDVREEDPYAQSHPLFACNMSLGRIEVDAYRRIPRLDTLIVLYDNSEGLALRAATTLKRMGYTCINLLEGGLSGWAATGAELFRDVNVPSKAFGEWVEAHKRTPSLPASEVRALIEKNADIVILDARRFDEYQTMSLPGAISVPGAELVLRARTIAPKPTTRIIVNCAGRTRSIIGAQSLVNAGIPNPVCALRNGTIGWMLEGEELVKGAQTRFPEVDPADLAKAQATALALAFRSGLKRIDMNEYHALKKEVNRTTYLFDVRTPEEFCVSHLKGALSAPGGQLVQETDHSAAVRGARIVLYDTEGVRAFMTGSWLVQLGWEVYVIKNISLNDLVPAQDLDDAVKLPELLGPIEEASPEQVKEWIANRTNLTLVIDVGDSSQYVKKHIPGAWWILRSQIEQDFSRVHKANRYVLTCPDGQASRYAVEELKQLVRPGVQVMHLRGGNKAWIEKGFSTQQGESYVVSPRIDRYKRPYEGTQNPAQAMQAYLDWEYGLVDQLKRDGTHGFKVI